MRKGLNNLVLKNVISLYGLQVANYVLPLLTFPYVARTLGEEKFGLLNWAVAIVGYFQLVTEYGFNFTVTRQVALHREDHAKLCRIFSTAMAARGLLLVSCFAALTLIIRAVPQFRSHGALFYLTFLTVVGYAAFPQWLFQGVEKMTWITIREIASRILGLAPVFVLVHRPDDYLWAAGVMAGSTCLSGLIGLLYVKPLTGVTLVATSFAEIRAMLREGFHVFLSTAAVSLYTRANLIILGFASSEVNLGLFAASLRPIESSKALVTPLSTAIFPYASRLGSNSKRELIQFINRNLMRLTAPFAVLSLGIAFGAPVAIRVLYGSKFDKAIPLMQIMAPIPFLVAFTAPYAAYYILGLGLNSVWLKIVTSAGIINLILLFSLFLIIPPADAAAVASTLSEFVILSLSYCAVRHHLGLQGAAGDMESEKK